MGDEGVGSPNERVHTNCDITWLMTMIRCVGVFQDAEFGSVGVGRILVYVVLWLYCYCVFLFWRGGLEGRREWGRRAVLGLVCVIQVYVRIEDSVHKVHCLCFCIE